MIRDNENRLKIAFLGTSYLLYALSDNNHNDTAYSLLLQQNYPSKLYEVNHGATTIWEHWDGVMEDGSFWNDSMNSYNHYAYGSVTGWVYSVAAGIKTDEAYAGFKKAIIKPHPDSRLDWLGAKLETAYGVISSKWTIEKDAIRYEISVPVETIIIIDSKKYNVCKGDYIFYGKNN